jgi:hypothetical protein
LITLIARQIPHVIFLQRYTPPRDLQCGLVSASKIQGPQNRHIDMSSIPCVDAEANPYRGTKVTGPTKCHQTRWAIDSKSQQVHMKITKNRVGVIQIFSLSSRQYTGMVHAQPTREEKGTPHRPRKSNVSRMAVPRRSN